jgi:HAD superfamily hydrolase (TIGR01549 family)
MNFNFYLFDLDGTLLNLGNMSAYADMILVSTLNKLKASRLPEKDQRSEFWSSGSNFISVLKKWGIKSPDRFWEHYDKIDFEYRKVFIEQKKIYLFNDVSPILKDLNHQENIKLAIVSNTSDFVVDHMLKKFNISQYFQDIYSMGVKVDQKTAKPSPNGILSVLARLNYDPLYHKALMIGDSKVDIAAAKKAGIQACLINRGLQRHSHHHNDWNFKPDYIIEKLDELLTL